VRDGDREKRLEVDPGHGTELLRRLWWNLAQPDGRPTAEQELNAAEGIVAAVLGFGRPRGGG
jgi:hypothetical protein